jgi:hypothetical protein
MADTNRKRNLPHVREDTLTVPKLIQEELLIDLRHLITDTRSAVAVTINAGLTTALLANRGNGSTGKFSARSVQGTANRLCTHLSAQLKLEFGEGFGKRNR